MYFFLCFVILCVYVWDAIVLLLSVVIYCFQWCGYAGLFYLYVGLCHIVKLEISVLLYINNTRGSRSL